jgi:hypothetical protein
MRLAHAVLAALRIRANQRSLTGAESALAVVPLLSHAGLLVCCIHHDASRASRSTGSVEEPS